MGLDISTWTKAEKAAAEAHDAKFENFDYDKATDAEKDEYHNWPRYTTVPSVKHPQDINERRYLRSSYNGGGFNNAVPRLTGNERDTYYHVFEPLIGDGEEYEIEVTDLGLVKECHGRALEVVDHLRSVGDTVSVTDVSAVPLRPDLYGEKNSAEDALRLYRQEAQKYKDAGGSFGSYSNALGDFWLDEPLKVRGAIPGTDIIGRPCLHLIFDVPNEVRESYLASAEVLVEYFEELAELVKHDGLAYIHWSG